ncbi:unnamed protein product [Gadus morhua 'NCC']
MGCQSGLGLIIRGRGGHHHADKTETVCLLQGKRKSDSTLIQPHMTGADPIMIPAAAGIQSTSHRRHPERLI